MSRVWLWAMDCRVEKGSVFVTPDRWRLARAFVFCQGAIFAGSESPLLRQTLLADTGLSVWEGGRQRLLAGGGAEGAKPSLQESAQARLETFLAVWPGDNPLRIYVR